MKSKDLFRLPLRGLFYSDEYGMTLVSEGYDWKVTLDSYVRRIDTKASPEDSNFIKTKKECFQREISIMRTVSDLPYLEVRSCPRPWPFCIYARAHTRTCESALHVYISIIL
jgi:hypothetical protein